MRRLVRVLTMVMLIVATACAQAQSDWPARPVTIVNPFAAGSAVDVVLRVVGGRMAVNFGQQVPIENRTGASGNIGTEYVARAKPDGYTWLAGSPGTMAINPYLFAKLPYDAQRDFVPAVHLVSFPQVLVVNPSLPIRTLDELVAYVRARAGAANYSSAGQGTTSHLVMEMIKADAKLAMTHVPYRGGAPAIQAVIAGDVQMAVEGLPSLPAQLKAGAVRPIVVTSAQRAALLPDVPALAESIAGFDASAWIIVFAPAGTAANALDRFAAEARRAMDDPPVRARLAELGATIVGTRSAETIVFHREQLEKFRRAVQLSGAKPE